jgi:hypothetical protein
MPETEITDFKDLIIWRKGMDIAEKCYFLTKLFPKDELPIFFYLDG